MSTYQLSVKTFPSPLKVSPELLGAILTPELQLAIKRLYLEASEHEAQTGMCVIPSDDGC